MCSLLIARPYDKFGLLLLFPKSVHCFILSCCHSFKNLLQIVIGFLVPIFFQSLSISLFPCSFNLFRILISSLFHFCLSTQGYGSILGQQVLIKQALLQPVLWVFHLQELFHYLHHFEDLLTKRYVLFPSCSESLAPVLLSFEKYTTAFSLDCIWYMCWLFSLAFHTLEYYIMFICISIRETSINTFDGGGILHTTNKKTVSFGSVKWPLLSIFEAKTWKKRF